MASHQARSGAPIDQIRAAVEGAFYGKPRVVELAVACLLARGHLLLEDTPGVGKTTLAMSLARAIGLEFRRVQFTSDMLPADIIGVSIWSEERGEFTLKRGPIFSELVLADEINRTTPRTQSALLEAMSERRVSIDNMTHDLPEAFYVIATQNPLESFGTYPLPESQLDRFLMRLSIGTPARPVERALLLERGIGEPVDALRPAIERADFDRLVAQTAEVRLSEEVADYILTVVERTRDDERVRHGVSTRGALAMARCARALALVRGRDFCVPDDARELFVPVFAHRVTPARGPAGGDRESAERLMESIARAVPIPV